MKGIATAINQGVVRTFAVLALIAVGLTASLHAAGFGAPPQLLAEPSYQLAAGFPNSTVAQPPARSHWEKRWWIDKTARLLRGGEGIGPDDDIELLLSLPEEEVARRFMADLRFGDTILDFNMFFLGFKADTLKSDGRYRSTAFDFANAVAAAQALLKGGDYFKLFDIEGPFYMAPLRAEPLEDPPQPQDAGLTPHDMRQKVVNEVKAILTELIASGSAARAPSGHAYCTQIMQFLGRQDEIGDQFYRGFEDAEIFALIRAQAISSVFNSIEFAADKECASKSRARADVSRLVDTVKTALDRFTTGFAEVFKFEPAVYAPQSVADFRTFDLSVFPKVKAWPAFGHEQGIALGNSSTNLNRKRAAYMLKRFFCDDLTPVGVDNPQEHVSGPHGTDTSCYACHYKLDPMAGFFRNYGSYFYDYSRSSEIIFDDLASTNRRRYESSMARASDIIAAVERRLHPLAALGGPERIRPDARRLVSHYPQGTGSATLPHEAAVRIRGGRKPNHRQRLSRSTDTAI